MSRFAKHCTITRKHRFLIIGISVAGILLILWFAMWQRIGKELDQAESDAAYSSFALEGAIYAACTETIMQEYLTEPIQYHAADCGSVLGEVSFHTAQGTTTGTVYRLRQLEDAGLKDAVILMQRGGRYTGYELVGFEALQNSPSISAVCNAYEIYSHADLQSVTITDADGAVLETVSDAKALSDFYEKLIALGDDIGAAGQAKAYYDAYVQKYGASDAIAINGDTVETADEDTYLKAMDLWSNGMCTVSIRLTNGLFLRDLVYAPIPGVFHVYGYYTITDSFFS